MTADALDRQTVSDKRSLTRGPASVDVGRSEVQIKSSDLRHTVAPPCHRPIANGLPAGGARPPCLLGPSIPPVPAKAVARKKLLVVAVDV